MTLRQLIISVIIATSFFPVPHKAYAVSPVTPERVFDMSTLSYQRELIVLPNIKIVSPPPSVPVEPRSVPQPTKATYDCTNAIRDQETTPLDRERWRSLVSQYSWPVDQVLLVMDRESSYNPKNVGDEHLPIYKNGIHYGCSIGLMMIRYLPGRPSPDWLMVPENNLNYAYNLWKSEGWCPWTEAKKAGLCRR